MTNRFRWTPLAALLILLALSSACVSLKMVSVDEKTELENQILGSFGELQKDLVLVASVRGEGRNEKKIPPAHREALMAMMERQFNADDVADLKAAGTAGEGKDGLLKLFDTERTKNDRAYRDFAKNLVEQENRDRSVILQRVIDMNPNLSGKDLPVVRRMLYRLNAESSAPGTRIQAETGEWIAKPAPVE